MKNIPFDHPHRRAHFDFFNQMTNPHFNICANVDVTELLDFSKRENLPITPTIVFFIAKAANEIKEFRWRIRDGQVVEHGEVHPSFSVYTDVADVFSFCEVKYAKDAREFINRANIKIEEMKTDPSFEDEYGRDDYLFLSAIPWVSFTSFQHAMNYNPIDSVPRITWGKFFNEGKIIKMPLSVQVHHAVVDGRHVGQYFQLFENLVQNPSGIFS